MNLSAENAAWFVSAAISGVLGVGFKRLLNSFDKLKDRVDELNVEVKVIKSRLDQGNIKFALLDSKIPKAE